MKKVLIIEDDIDTLEMVALILQDQGFEVVSSTRKLTVWQVSNINPAIIILDYNLGDGVTNHLYYELKNTPETSHIPVLLYSAGLAVDRLPQNASADAYLDKPFDIEELIEIVVRLAS